MTASQVANFIGQAVAAAQAVLKKHGFEGAISSISFDDTSHGNKSADHIRGCRCVRWGTDSDGNIQCKQWECD